MALLSSLFSSPPLIFTLSIFLRLILLLWGLYQDAYTPIKYTDIDYFVFTDAARFLARGRSPYDRDTYRYTPLLAWLLLPTTWGGLWFHFGKLLFAIADVVAGYLAWSILRVRYGLTSQRALAFASIWLLNPMVATISTRGNSESLLGVLAAVLLWAVLGRRVALAGVLLGFAVHFKIYPFMYAMSILWWLDEEHLGRTSPPVKEGEGLLGMVSSFVNRERIELAVYSLATFMGLNAAMYYL
jgi:phosphatidylinositol glycan class M